MRSWSLWFCVAVAAVVGVAVVIRSAGTERPEAGPREVARAPEKSEPSPEPVVADPAREEIKPGEADPTQPKKKKSKKPDPPADVRELRALLWSKDRKELRRGVDQLRKWKDAAEQAELIRAMIREGGDEQRWAALYLLSRIELPDRPALVATMVLGESPDGMRHDAVRLLAKIQDPSSVSILQEAASAGPLRTRVEAASALEQMGVRGPSDPVIQDVGALAGHEDGARREDAVRLLGEFRNPAVVAYLERALKDTNSRVRRSAAQSLGQTGLESVIPLLEAATRDPERDVRSAATKAIERIRKGK